MEQNDQILSLSWDSHQKNICTGLSQLQQRGEFVDMTLAADGHHVKVHQMVLSLVSPYIRDLISTAQCSHPVIFLNNISYTTLCAILEYIYTGEVHVPKNRLSDLISAGKALHIRGLREMDSPESVTAANTSVPEKVNIVKEKKKIDLPKKEKELPPAPTCKIYLDESNSTHEDSAMYIQDSMMETQEDPTTVGETSQDITETLNNAKNEQSDKIQEVSSDETRRTLLSDKVQYTVSNQGGLQIIFNRYIYQLRYIKKNGTRHWRCITYNKTRCAASILTNVYNEVEERKFEHNHPFHDKNILHKLRLGTIFARYKEASIQSELSQMLQYSVSIQGGLQVIHNRYIYHLRYFGKKNRKRFWRCIDYSSNLKCPANISTDENNQVTERSFTHNHGFHDVKIIKKLRSGILYSVFHDAATKADGKKKERRVPCSATDDTSE